MKDASAPNLRHEDRTRSKPATLLAEAGAEQIRYARVLEKGMLLGLLVLFLSFLLYVFEILEPFIPLHKIADYWSVDVETYLDSAGVKAGWSWVGLLGYGDFLNFVGIAMLSGTTILCYLAILPILWRTNDSIYLALAILEVIVLSVAASGVLGT
ncbi:MAG: hypothetical protein P8Y25_15985 [Chromatiaceae bacterium]